MTPPIILVTGGSGNLGQAVVAAFHADGARLVVPDRGTGRLAALFPALANSPDHFLAEGFNTTEPEGMDRLVQETLARFGRIDALVNTIGGYQAGKPLHETTLDTWDAMMNLNARSVFVTCRAVVPAMLAQGYGRIVNVAAASALKGGANESAYSASKSAVARLTEGMAAEYGRYGLRVNAVLPGALDTPQNRAAAPDADFSRWVSPSALATALLFLCSAANTAFNGALITC
jgi:NAD(P)-dependent dehydrogenase (short-subunit alcohol dehydrogenase family)